MSRRRVVTTVMVVLFAATTLMAGEIPHQINSSSGQLPSFVGTFNPDLNIVSAGAFFDAGSFTFESDQSGPIGTTAGAFYVWGINRGANLTPFAPFSIGQDNVSFDTVVILFDNAGAGSGFVDDLLTSTTTPLPAGSVTFSGNTIDGTVSAALLPSIGKLAPSQYQVNLWTRVGLNPADKTQLAEFAPNNMNVPVETPEPAGFGLMSLGLAGIAVLARRHSTRA
jgi:hypothetical protein